MRLGIGLGLSQRRDVPPFKISDLTSLAGWYVADEQAGADLSPVSTFVDRSDKGKNWIGPVGNEPFLRHNMVNGLKALEFQRSTSRYMTQADLLSGATAASFFAVVKMRAEPDTTGGALLSRFPAVESLFTFTDGAIYEGFGTTARKAGVNPALPLDTWRIYSIHTAPSDYRIYLGKDLIYSDTTNIVDFSTAAGSRLLGWSNPIGSNWFDGFIAEMVFTNAVLSPSDMASVNKNLASKYALTL